MSLALRPSKKIHLFKQIVLPDGDWWNNQVTNDKDVKTPPNSPLEAIHPLSDEFREDLGDYTTKWGNIEMEFKNGQVFPLYSNPNHSNCSHFVTPYLQNLENISSNCI